VYFQVGDEVQVTGLPTSEWQNSRGVIVEIIERTLPVSTVKMQDCVVMFRDCRRCWFLSAHLSKSVPEPVVHFIRSVDPDLAL
jgi:hypothetical protein